MISISKSVIRPGMTTSCAKNTIQGVRVSATINKSALSNNTIRSIHSNKSLHTSTATTHHGTRITHKSTLYTPTPTPTVKPTPTPTPTPRNPNKSKYLNYSTSKPKSFADPHQEAATRIAQANTSIDKRPSGVDSLNTITPLQKFQNYALAISLIGFCSSVYSYSISSVGKAEISIDDLKDEASGAMELQKEEERQKQMEEDMAQVDVTLAQVDTEEEERLMVEQAQLSSAGEKKKRALWKKIVFFWKKE